MNVEHKTNGSDAMGMLWCPGDGKDPVKVRQMTALRIIKHH